MEEEKNGEPALDRLFSFIRCVLYKKPCLSVGRLVPRLVSRLVGRLVADRRSDGPFVGKEFDKIGKPKIDFVDDSVYDKPPERPESYKSQTGLEKY